MAQPVFDEREHPLGEYLRDVGETHYILPGVTPDLERDLEAHYRAKYDLNDQDREEADEEGPEWRPRALIQLSDVLWRFIQQSLSTTTTTTTTTGERHTTVANPCVERFKYTVISSSLLSSSLPVHHHSTRTPSSSSSSSTTSGSLSSSFVIPGKLHGVGDGGSPSPSKAGLLRTNGNNAAVAAPTGPPAVGETRQPREQQQQQYHRDDASPSTITASILGSISVLFLSLGWSSLAVLSAVIAVYCYCSCVGYVSQRWRRRQQQQGLADEKESIAVRPDIELTIDALGELISANRSWESVVQDTISFLEDEERTPYSSSLSSHRLPSSPSPLSPPFSSSIFPPPSSASPSTPIRIRVALHTCLQTTQSQCDNIRRLFSALTCPAELSQLAEMYAPPSPSPLRVTFGSGSGGRPWSYPVGAAASASVSVPSTRHRSPLMSPTKTFSDTNKLNKRSTWSGGQQQHGSYASLADAGSPTSVVYRNGRRRRRREASSLDDVFGYDAVTTTKEEAAEEEEQEEEQEAVTGQFASAALDLQRKRRSGGMEAFFLTGSSPLPPPPSPSLLLLRTPPPPSNHRSAQMKKKRPSHLSPLPTTTTSASVSASPSRYTRSQPARRHPLSFASLTCALQGALGAKRYACAHLLALRFYGEDSHPGGGVEHQQGDGDYWENVRSVVLLLTSALVDSAGRLGEALEDAEGVKLREGEVTPPKGEETRRRRTSSGQGGAGLFGLAATTANNSAPSSSFAPMPSVISRFAAHVAAISSALDDAKEHLEKCVEALKNNNEVEEEKTTTTKALALEAYERLRRELGIALRECERGRERLIEVVVYHPPNISSNSSDDEEVEVEVEGLPALGHDASDESDKFDPVSPRSEVGETTTTNAPGAAVVEVKMVEDDVTAHLLWTSSAQHLPMPGIEEVFEAEQEQAHSTTATATSDGGGGGGVAVGPFLRERSKLTREERVRMAKRARMMMMEEEEEGGVVGLGIGIGGGGEEKQKMERERWGPGGDVVQELKDVIWKVGERKRKLGEAANNGEPTTTTTPAPVASVIERILDSQLPSSS